MNINEIAKLAGVSRATVSRYLNDGYVSQEKRQAIKTVIDATGYTPSVQAKMLRTNKTMQVGIVLPEIRSDFACEMGDGMTSVLAEKGYYILLGNAKNSTSRELEYLNIFRNNRVDGIIFIPTGYSEEKQKFLDQLTTPCVVIGQQMKGHSCVCFDDYEAARNMTELLVRRGRRQYAMLAVSRSNWGVKQEQDGFRAVLSEHGIPDDHIIITETGYGISDGYQAMRQLLSRKPEIDAVFVAADEIAVGAVNAVRDLGRRIPEDISVVSLGDTKLAEIISPKLTTARYFYRESGVEAAEMLLEMMEGKNLTARVRKMGFEVICRETV
ncbi:LacI family DNA-binding transcriptional regulator [Diplocloster agilis]|uniref:LacI family transcriptional regulator n=1 Tax=Diplocloster agilis TaxID=2850323 RepID=A0A949NDA4_9FIRM|nr:LacI family DNA-binding transcriptional regulator [Diplocloster agilis]MBU9734944.1 LacI family transcriptional regulator [Diplocloster agilis]